jgi:hypothetical protein
MPRVIDGFTQFFDNAGAPLVAGTLKFTESGSNATLKDTYSDFAESVANTNPVVLDASGRCSDVFGTGSYRVTSYDSDGVQIEQFDPMPGIGGVGDFADWDTTVTYAARDIVVGSDGAYYRSLVGSNTANDPAYGAEPTYWEVVQIISVFNVNKAYAVDDIVLWTDGVLYTCETATTAGDTPVTEPTKWSPDITYTTVASHATTSAIWVVKNSIINFTGAETITDFPAATKAGEERTLICAGATVFTHAGNITVQGGATYTAAANMVVVVTAITTTTFHVRPTFVDATILGALIASLTGKTTPVDADTLAISDSAASAIGKKVTFANLKAFLVSDTAYNATSWNGVTTIAPSKNAVRDEFELRAPKANPTFSGTVTSSHILGPALLALESNRQLQIQGNVDNSLSGTDPVIYFQLGSSYTLAADFDANGAFDIVGALSKGSGSFKIDHPVDPDNKILYHSFIEGPRVDLIYRGVAKLKHGSATIDLNKDSSVAGMMPGTFEALTQNAVVTSLHNQDGFARVRSEKIIGAKFKIVCEEYASTDEVAWVVIAERGDAFIKTWSVTDADGRMVPEQDKEEATPENLKALDPEIVETDEKDKPDEIVPVNELTKKKGYRIHSEAYGVTRPERVKRFKYKKPVNSTRS